MTRLLLSLAAASLFAGGGAPQPFANETLHYSVNWPSGLSLGEGRMQAARAGERYEFNLSIEAALPGFAITDRFRSIAADDFSSLEFEKEFTNGKRKAHERTTFDPQGRTATRQTLNGGGKTELKTSAGAKDALAFLYFVRRELAQGRLPQPQTIYFGAPYQVKVEYSGVQPVRVSDASVQADKLVANLSGPSSKLTLEMFFARDAARTPVLIRAPFSLGTFSLELVR